MKLNHSGSLKIGFGFKPAFAVGSAQAFRRLSPVLAGGVFLALVVAATGSLAQGILAPPPVDLSGLPPALQTTGTNQPGVRLSAPPPAAPTPEGPLLQWGPVELHPHFLYRLLYGDGIPVQPGQDLTTFINEIYPGLLILLGTHWTLDYTPTLSFYSNHQFRDTWDNAVTLAGSTQSHDWTLGFSQGYISSSQPLIETGGQTDQATYPTAVNATYQASSQVSIELGANQILQSYGQAPGGQELSGYWNWSTTDWLNYQTNPKLGLAVGLGFGYDMVSLGSDMTYEELQGRINWRPGEKLTLLVSGGGQYRQFLDSATPAKLTPIFGASLLYLLFEPTTFSLTASRTLSPAASSGELSANTSLSAGVHQRLFTHLFLDVGGGCYTTSYTSTSVGLAASREDHGAFFRARLGAQVLKRGSAGVFYQWSENSSTDSSFAFTSSQVGLELGYQF